MTTKIDGTNGIIFPDSTTQGTAATNLGVGQSWQSVSHGSGVTVTNSTGKPIVVIIGVTAVSGSPNITVVVAGTTIINYTFPYGIGNPVTFIVPNGSTYSATWPSGTTLAYWNELR